MNAESDLAKLRIDRSLAPIQSRRRRKWLLARRARGPRGRRRRRGMALQPRAVTVQTTPVVTTYPSQQFVVLNATGYVVAQRKAAIASKATGRLEWLGVAEGSRVKAGDVIARLDNRDVVAQAQSAEANVRAAQAALAQAQAEETRRDGVARSATRTCSPRASSRRPRSTRRRCAPTARWPASPMPERRSASPRPTRATRRSASTTR